MEDYSGFKGGCGHTEKQVKDSAFAVVSCICLAVIVAVIAAIIQ